MNNNNDNNQEHRMVTHQQMLRRGLRAAKSHLGTQKHLALVADFKSHYGNHPKQCATMWRELIETGRVADAEEDLLAFFAALSFLKLYEKEKKRRSTFDMNVRPLRELTWTWVQKIASLKGLKIVWRNDDEWDTIYIISVDGTHRRVNEPRDPVVRKNRKN